jgi:hypothetical protein
MGRSLHPHSCIETIFTRFVKEELCEGEVMKGEYARQYRG